MNAELSDELFVASYTSNMRRLSHTLSHLQLEEERAEAEMKDKIRIKSTSHPVTDEASSSSIPVIPTPASSPLTQLCELCDCATAVFVCWSCNRNSRFYCFDCHSKFHKPRKFMHHQYAALAGHHLTMSNESRHGAFDSTPAPWQKMPEAVWGLILQWIPSHQDIVNVACLNRSSLAHPAIRQWNWNKPLLLRDVARLANHPSLPDHNRYRRTRSAEADAAVAAVAAINTTLPSKRVNLQIGSKGVARRLFIGVEESQWAANEELELLPHIAQLAPHAHEITYCLTHPEPLKGLGPLPPALRVLTLKLGNRQYGRILPSNAEITKPLGQLLQLPSTLTELNLAEVNRQPEVILPLLGLKLPKSLLKLQLPTMTFPLTQLELPHGLTTLHTGGAFVSDRNDLTDSAEMNQSIASEWANLPPLLTHLTIGSPTASSKASVLAIEIIKLMKLPQGLETLEMKGIVLSVNELNGLLPPSLKRLHLDGFLELRQGFLPTTWALPPNLQELELSLRQLHTDGWRSRDRRLPHLPSHFEPIFESHLMQLPSSLRSIVGFPPIDPDTISQVRLPNSLTSLKFGPYFNCPLEQLQFPSQLEVLSLGDYFSCSFSRVHFPSTLTELRVGIRWSQELSELRLPDTLRRLTLLGFNKHMPSNYEWPSQLEYLEFGSWINNHQPPNFKDWNPPQKLLHLRVKSLGYYFKEEEQKWPPLMQFLDFREVSRPRLHWTNWPPTLTELHLHLEWEISFFIRRKHPITWYERVTVEQLPASLRKLSLTLPHFGQYRDFWAQLEQFVSHLSHTLEEIEWICPVESRETLELCKRAIRRACSCLPLRMKIKIVGQMASDFSPQCFINF